MNPITIQSIALVILILLSAFFSSAETSLTTVSAIRVRSLIEEGNKRAVRLNKVLENKGKMLSAILIGNNIVNISASALATMIAQQIGGNEAVSLSTGILTIVVLIFGEISPKTLATVNAEPMALFYAPIIAALIWVLTPLIFIINKLAGLVLKLFHTDPNQKANVITETELRTIVDVSHEEGILETEERKIITKVFDFGDTTAKDIMVPRIDMVAIEVNSSYEELMEVFKRDKYTRLPVYEDTADNVIGIINVKDLLLSGTEPAEDFHIRDYLREAFYTYESKSLTDLMIEMRKAAVNIIIVLDEYSDAVGLITLEDILEEIVGEIRDEYDYDEADLIQSDNQTVFTVSGQTKISDINDELHLNLMSEAYESIAGIIIEALDKIPEIGDTVTFDDCILEVLTLDKKRVDTIRVTLIPKETCDSSDGKASDKKDVQRTRDIS